MNDTTKSVLIKVLTDSLKMLHPFMPYVTEEIYGMLPIKEEESIMISNYPVAEENLIFTQEKEQLDKINNIENIRNATEESVNHDIENMCSYKEDKYNTEEKIMELGKQLFDNVQTYGSLDWYEWCVKNWGTKWNADTLSVSDDEIIFNTAWSPSEPIIKELSSKGKSITNISASITFVISCHSLIIIS